jgi:hypothetical protein
MKDRSKLVTLVALIALVFTFASAEGSFPGLEAFGSSVFWTLFAVMIFFLIRGGGCCKKRMESNDGEMEN